MGGCASRPKDLDVEAEVPAQDPAKTVPEPVSETVPLESTGGEEKKEEPLVDVSAPADEAPKAEEATAEPEATSEVTTEEKPEEPKEEAAVEEPAKEPEAEEVPLKSEEKTEDVSTPVV
ncbi:phosphatidylinositol transfer protein sfh5-like [Heracleum sosnowskyi]|uniref:Phosphatidylinositol transfer protein sfh5-like n=1 Tax=Heracleum sosnowskyi TaxID=360622 RepID=A0AAD8J807_9APIA|nr:phosphatidylinositol transfer protein sfh5-like [Heracleum sosnowskyi]